MKHLFICLLAFGISLYAYCTDTSVASWGAVSISANTDVAASSYLGVSTAPILRSNKAMTTSSAYAYYGSSAGGATIILSGLPTKYKIKTVSFYSRASKGGTFTVSYSTDGGSNYTGSVTSGTIATKNTPKQYSVSFSSLPSGVTNIKLVHSASSGSLYFGTVSVVAETYTVTYAANGGSGTMTDKNSPYSKDGSVTLLDNGFTAPSGKVFNGWVVTDASSNPVTVTDGQFTMPASNVTVTAQWASASSDKYYLAGSMTDWATNKIELTGSPLSTTVALAANTSYTFKMMKNSDTWYGNGGAIITNISGWGFSSSDANNCRLYTGPAGDYTFTFDPTTGNVSVTYPTVSHPAVGYSYFKKYGTDTSIKAYIYTSDDDRVSDWEGSPAVTATTTICGDTYFYFALQGCGKNNVIIRYSNTQTAAMSATSASQKWAESSSSAFSAFATFTISFAAGTGASGSMSAISNIECGTNREITACGFTAPTGKEFDCWHANVDVIVGGATITAGKDIAGGATIQNIKNDITLTAQWKNLSYTITPTLNNCKVTGTAIPASVVYGGSFSTTISPTDASYQLPNSVTSISGATVTSWDASTGELTIGNVTGNVTFTITATKKTYTVTFYNVGELKKTVSNVEHGTLFSAIKPTVGTGSGQLDISSCDATSTTFMGWTSDASFQKRSNAPSFITDDTAITGDLELRAVWARAE